MRFDQEALQEELLFVIRKNKLGRGDVNVLLPSTSNDVLSRRDNTKRHCGSFLHALVTI
jgi:hypothetical protein